MEIVILLVPLGLLLASVAVAAFIWGLRRGQFDDLESRGWGVIFDDQARARPDIPGTDDATAPIPAAGARLARDSQDNGATAPAPAVGARLARESRDDDTATARDDTNAPSHNPVRRDPRP